MKRQNIITLLALTAVLAFSPLAQADDVTPAEARAIAKEAYIYGYPLVDSYRIQYAYFVDRDDKSFKAPWNQIKNIPNVYTPADTAVQTPNSDTPYSWAGLDLRAEPIVLTVPEIEKDRYYSVQFIDAYTFNFAYVGQPYHGQRCRQLPRRRAGLERREAQGREKGDSVRDGFHRRRLSHAAVQPGRHRQRDQDPGRLQSADAVGVSGYARTRRPRRPSI